jgi:hypothetical protein
MPRDRVRPSVQALSGQLRSQLDHPLTNLLGRGDRRRLRTPGARLKRLQTPFPVASQQAVQMLTGEPVLDSRLGDRQLMGDDLENSNADTGHALRLSAAPRTRRAGDRRYGIALRAPPPRRPSQPLSTPKPGVTYVPRHEGPIT